MKRKVCKRVFPRPMIPSYSYCTPLPLGDPEYSKITQTVLKSYPKACITMIDRYENPKLREEYEAWRKTLEEYQKQTPAKNGELFTRPYDHEFTVYHGTKQEFVEGICRYGFRPEKGRIMALGFGIYFATEFRTSWGYTNNGSEENDPMSYIFICKILPGHMEPPLANQEPTPGYHSRANYPSAPTVFVIPQPMMMIPEYLVRFHKVSEMSYVEKEESIPVGHHMTEKQAAKEAKRLAATVKKLEKKSLSRN